MCEILNGFWEFLSIWFLWTSEFLSMPHYNFTEVYAYHPRF